MEIDVAYLKQWIGKTETLVDRVVPVPLRALAAALDRDDPVPREGDEVPPGWHWLYFLPTPRQSEVGADGGNPTGGDFLPPVPLDRRMWAGSRIRWNFPLRVGRAYTRTSRIVAVDVKAGRRGPLVFVQVRNEFTDEAGIAIQEDRDIVYRDLSRPGEVAPAPEHAPVTCDWSRELRADPVFLFRYSALTFNGHRIHYDRPYATGIEGYPGLLVHGPLLATLLLDLLRRSVPKARVASFTFRALRPVFDHTPFRVCGAWLESGSRVRLWITPGDGTLAMDATAELA
jgi:3-methylfumaryl-CoA hydratase